MRDVKYLIRLDDACPTMDWARSKRVSIVLDEYNCSNGKPAFRNALNFS